MHASIEHLGNFEKVLTQNKVPFRYVRLYQDEALPPEVPAGDGLIVLGGPMSVHDHAAHPWIRPEIGLVARAVKADRPVLGICLGAQILAAALGAKVYPAMAGEIGCSPVACSGKLKKGTAFDVFAEELVVFQWHTDTFDLPSGARRVMRGLMVPNQAFVYWRNAYATQFHPEVTAEMVAQWIDAYPQDLKAAGIENRHLLTTTFDAHSYGMEMTGRKFFDNFLKLTGLISASDGA